MAFPTWVALYFLPSKKVHVISPHFYPSEPLSFEPVSRERPLLMQSWGCEGIGHDETIAVTGVGCLLLAPPSLTLAAQYPFNRTFLFVGFEGLGPREHAGGRWNRPLHGAVEVDSRSAPGAGQSAHIPESPPQPFVAARRRCRSGSCSPGEPSSTPRRRLEIGSGSACRSRAPTGQETACGRCRSRSISRTASARHQVMFEELSIGVSPTGRVVSQ